MHLLINFLLCLLYVGLPIDVLVTLIGIHYTKKGKKKMQEVIVNLEVRDIV